MIYLEIKFKRVYDRRNFFLNLLALHELTGRRILRRGTEIVGRAPTPSVLS